MCNTGIDDLDDVITMLEPVSKKWKQLGLALGLKMPTIEKICAEHPDDTDECKLQMLSCWLKRRDDCEATCNWKSLAEALKRPTVNHKPIAGAIEKKLSELKSAD